MCFPEFGDERYAIPKLKTGMHGCVQRSTCNWWECGVGVLCGSKNVGRRLQNDIGHAILNICSLGVAMILIKQGLRDSAKKGCI